ncbi:ABC transporter ATP-binding protein [Deinococcus humi]|uniref:ABC-2 type transport system ATP-binding protein n=1 Tax=Deinococcus humi TaxID=662880 RepID=A0A7W8NE28_9DEIO|nr:ATP-binding cassette domain-containing protein [Deinococcus humi]MBB5362250.1 ABC-2 type transport system ATP-binding protein [Deinococcus humi]GGO21348.1 ABC transporter ATP-binding protein [Deinococcus humi]
MTHSLPDASVHVRDLKKQYAVHEKEPGFMGSLRSFVSRKTKYVEAVRGVSFELAPGEVVGFLGPNGAGKTTTLKMLSGLLHPSDGMARIAGYEPRKRETAFLKQITLVMGQKQQLIWDLPALDSFLVNQAIYEIPDDQYRATMREFTEVLSLEGILKKQVRKLSLGERMKCELAAALLHRPRVLFLDEPTIGLDVNMQESVRAFIRDYNERYDATVILTSHYMADVTALAQRILVIDRGELVFDGDLARLAEQGKGGKTVKLKLREAVSAAHLAHYGHDVKVDGLSAELTVPRAEVSTRAARLLADLDVADLTVEDPPIEAVMAELFGGGEKAGEVKEVVSG